MTKAKVILTAILALCLCGICRGQNLSDLIISEVYVGQAPWIEVLNTSNGTVKFSGCFLTDDRNDLRKYYISKRDAKTSVGPKQLVVFYADSLSNEGTFHTNFTLKPGSTAYLVSTDGRTIIDSLSVPSTIDSLKSIAKFCHDAKELIFDDIHEADPTPGSFNTLGIVQSKAERIAQKDPHGLTITLVSVSVVFGSLLLLFIAYTIVGIVCNTDFKKLFAKCRSRKKKAGAEPDADTAAAIALALDLAQNESNETEAAIAMALHLYLNEQVHDKESYVITIRRKH